MVALSGALMPGPLLTVTISESPRRGYWTGPLLILGHGVLELTLVAALFLGLAPLLRTRTMLIISALAGAAVLAWLAGGMIKGLPRLTLQPAATADTRRNLFAAGIVFSIANPYWIVWWVTIGLGYVTQSLQFGIWGVLFFFSGHILADLFWYSAVSTTVWKGRRLMSDRLYRGMIAGCAALLLLFAGMFAWSGLSRWLT